MRPELSLLQQPRVGADEVIARRVRPTLHTPVRRPVPMRAPLLEQLCIGGTLRHGMLDKSCAPIGAPLTAKSKIAKHQGRAEGGRIAALVGHTPECVGSVN